MNANPHRTCHPPSSPPPNQQHNHLTEGVFSARRTPNALLTCTALPTGSFQASRRGPSQERAGEHDHDYGRGFFYGTAALISCRGRPRSRQAHVSLPVRRIPGFALLLRQWPSCMRSRRPVIALSGGA